MNIFSLMLALKAHLEQRTISLPLASRLRDAGADIKRPPRIYLGQLPPKSGQLAYETPFLLIQAMNGFESVEGWAEAEIALRFAVYNDDTEGAENDLHNFIAFCRHSLLAFRQNALNGQFVLMEKEGAYLPWTRPDDQAPPFLEAYVISNWKFQGIE